MYEGFYGCRCVKAAQSDSFCGILFLLVARFEDATIRSDETLANEITIIKYTRSHTHTQNILYHETYTHPQFTHPTHTYSEIYMYVHIFVYELSVFISHILVCVLFNHLFFKYSICSLVFVNLIYIGNIYFTIGLIPIKTCVTV